jgi:hypothetical protein
MGAGIPCAVDLREIHGRATFTIGMIYALQFIIVSWQRYSGNVWIVQKDGPKGSSGNFGCHQIEKSISQANFKHIEGPPCQNFLVHLAHPSTDTILLQFYNFYDIKMKNQFHKQILNI